MSEKEVSGSSGGEPLVLEGGAYEIIRGRLSEHAKELRARLDKLNQARHEVFGSVETALLGAERVTTEHNCIPRDIVPLGDNQVLFGYNVHFGLKTAIQLSDVFAVYRREEGNFVATSLDPLKSGAFEEDFKSLYKYYKATQFAKFSFIGPYLFMVFRVSQKVNDIKTFKWLVKDGAIEYADNRSDYEFSYPDQFEFEWKRTTRDLHRGGTFPHISIEDRVFVECVGGDLTIKVEDNTETGEGIYSEKVDYADQTLDDAEIFYATVGDLVLLKLRPFQEKRFRYLVYNGKTTSVERIDALESACVLLPEDHGIIFSNGYYLQTGVLKVFDTENSDMLFERLMRSSNGEDYLYVFYNRKAGDYVLLLYNLIQRSVENPILCNGFLFFPNGELIYFRGENEPQKHHVIQIWKTPFVDSAFEVQTPDDSFLAKIGNRDVVRCMAECNEILGLIQSDETYANLYVDIVKRASDVADSYFWVDKEEAFNLQEILLEVGQTANRAIDEFEKVRRIRRQTSSEIQRVRKQCEALLRPIDPSRMGDINDYVSRLAGLRSVRGEIIALRDLRYVDRPLVDDLEKRVVEQTDNLSTQCVQFLLKPEALDPYREKAQAQEGKISEVTKVTEAKALEEEIAGAGAELEMLIDIVSNLKIEDATETTRIIDAVTEIYSSLNQIKAGLKKKNKELFLVEGKAQFNAQLKLLSQSIINYLDISDTPDKCEEYMNKVMVQLEELEGAFADIEEFTGPLAEKRAEMYEAFEARKINLIEERNRKATALMAAAERILKVIRHRIAGMDSINDINGYMASDLMIEKIRGTIDRLGELDDSVKADDLQGRLKSAQEDAIRSLKDRQELFVEGQNLIQFGKHRFSVNVQELDLTIVYRNGEMCLHMTGTKYFEPVTNERFLETKPVWEQRVVSENKDVYRAEYLAAKMVAWLETGEELSLSEAAELSDQDRLEQVRRFMGTRYAEGYSKGVHDHDAARILGALITTRLGLGLVRFQPASRACAAVYWTRFCPPQDKELWSAKLNGFEIKNQVFPGDEEHQGYIRALRELIGGFLSETALMEDEVVEEAGEFLFYALCGGGHFVISQEAARWYKDFQSHLKQKRVLNKFETAREAVKDDPISEFDLIRDWLRGYCQNKEVDSSADYLDEVASLFFCGHFDSRFVNQQPSRHELTGMMGSHSVIQDDRYQLNYLAFQKRIHGFLSQEAPLFERYQRLKQEIIKEARSRMRLEEFEPRVLTSFVRNKLIDKVYLPLIGDNLAKQIGAAGAKKRTDLMGLLLLVSPPGYGKTTLMEYLSNRLGIIFVKINGPALGAHVTSLDPEEAPNASARAEVNKLNLALEMGDNVMIYLDDIQHCDPEFLQKFISLCDAQRRIEGVFRGRPRTYDLRGRKVVVVMAGNPYTESGEKFRIPDMLANRADTYNLGDIIGASEDFFKASYLENAVTSNASLQSLSNKSQKDIQSFIRIAETGSREGVDFESKHSVEEIEEIVSVFSKLNQIRDAVLGVNQEYIRSAAQAEAYRTEPPFKLQGSYRNMNRMAEKVLPIMNDQELQELIADHYANESQTLTSGAEANLLKFKEITHCLSPEEEERWNEIKKRFQRNLLLGQADSSDPVGRVVNQLSMFGDGLNSIRDTLSQGMSRPETRGGGESKIDWAPLVDQFSVLGEKLSDLKGAFVKDANGPSPDLAEAVKAGMAPLSQFNSGLESIRKVLDEGMKRGLSGGDSVSADRVSGQLASVNKELNSIREALENYQQAKQVDADDHPSPPSPVPDVKEISITRATLEKIYNLIEDDKSQTADGTEDEKQIIQIPKGELDS